MTKMKFILGIDPGLSGALAFLVDAEVDVLDMPTLRLARGRKARRELDLSITRSLAGLYHKIRGSKATSNRYDKRSGERRGPSIQFFQAALAPIPHKLSSHGLRKLIERASV